MGTKQYPTIDLFKFIAATMVVALHTRPLYGNNYEYYLNTLLVYAVPFFFCTSSFLFWKKGTDIKKYLKRLAELYLIWFIIEFPFVYLRYFQSNDIMYNIYNFTRNFILQNTFYASWYLTASIEAMLLVYYISQKANKHVLYLFSAMCFFLSLFASTYYGVLDSVPNGYTIKRILSFIYASQSFIVAVPFVTLGKVIAESKLTKFPNASRLIALLILFISVSMVESFFGKDISNGTSSSLSKCPIIYLLVLFTLKYQVKINQSLLIFLRKVSILVYLLHPIYIYLFQHVLGGVEFGLNLFFLTMINSTITGWLIIAISDRLTFFKKLY